MTSFPLLATLAVMLFGAATQAQVPGRVATAADSGAALPATDVTAADIAGFINSLPRGEVSDLPIRVIGVGGSQVGVYGVFRPKSLAGEAVLHETTISEIYYMLKGSGTLVTGGTLGRTEKPGASPRADRGDRIDGGVSRKVSPGDVIVIPGRTPHWWSQLDSDIEYLIIRADPDSRLRLK